MWSSVRTTPAPAAPLSGGCVRQGAQLQKGGGPVSGTGAQLQKGRDPPRGLLGCQDLGASFKA